MHSHLIYQKPDRALHIHGIMNSVSPTLWVQVAYIVENNGGRGSVCLLYGSVLQCGSNMDVSVLLQRHNSL